MKRDDNIDEADIAVFDGALARREAGDLAGAIEVLEQLAEKLPNKAPILGMLAGLQYEAGDYENSALNARKTVVLSPKSEMASLNLFHALHQLGKIDDAFRELARFRSIKHSAEYDRMLSEVETGTLLTLQNKPFDSFQNETLNRVRKELRARPIKQ